MINILKIMDMFLETKYSLLYKFNIIKLNWDISFYVVYLHENDLSIKE